MPSRNQAIIEEFRANEGRVGGYFEGRPMLLLTHTGARTGRTYTNPLVYLPDDGRLVIFAARGGAPTNPNWYRNLKAHPTATVEVGTETYDVDVTELEGEERDRLYARQAESCRPSSTTRRAPRGGSPSWRSPGGAESAHLGARPRRSGAAGGWCPRPHTKPFSRGTSGFRFPRGEYR